MSVAGRVAMVTGAASGVGMATTRLLAADGVSVMAVDFNREAGQALAEELTGAGHQVAFQPADVSRPEDCRAAVEATVARFGRIEYLVNCAGIIDIPLRPAHEVEEEGWDRVMDVNAKGTFFCCKYAIEHMRPQKFGVILNMSSVAAEKPTPGQIVYNASKAAVLQMTRNLAVEYYADNIRAAALLPGGINTHMAQQNAPGMDMSTILMAPEQVAKVLRLLLQDDAEVVFGAAIRVDGGLTAAQEAGNLWQGMGMPDAAT